MSKIVCRVFDIFSLSLCHAVPFGRIIYKYGTFIASNELKQQFTARLHLVFTGKSQVVFYTHTFRRIDACDDGLKSMEYFRMIW